MEPYPKAKTAGIPWVPAVFIASPYFTMLGKAKEMAGM